MHFARKLMSKWNPSIRICSFCFPLIHFELYPIDDGYNHCLVLVATWNCCFYCIDNGKHKINEKLSLHCEHFHWKKARLAINMKNWRNLLKLREDLIDGCFRFHLNCYVSRNYNYVVYCNLWLNFGNLSGI